MNQPVGLLMVGGDLQCRHDSIWSDLGELQADCSIEAVAEIMLEVLRLLCSDGATLDGEPPCSGGRPYPALQSKQCAVAGRASRRAPPISSPQRSQMP